MPSTKEIATTMWPLPWEARRTMGTMRSYIFDATGAKVIGGINNLKADFIVAAVNQVATASDLLPWVKLLEQSVAYEIRKSRKEGDEEGARLKIGTLNMVRDAIAKAEGKETE